MMKKNTILKILSFVLVLTMVVAAVLLTGCGNKKEDPKASQAELDAAKAALEAAQAEIEKIQANIDKMTKDGSATADDLKKAQEELEAAQKALDELAKASTSEEVYNALYGEDSDKTLAKYAAKVVELADAKRNIEYIVGYGEDDLALDADRKNWNKVGDDYTKGTNYAAFAATPVGAVEVKCLAWMASRLALATSTKVVDQVWADMEAAFAGIKKIVDKYDDELASLLPDANGGKLTLIKTDKDGNKVDQLADLNSYRNWIIKKSAKLKFNGATDEVAEPKKAEYDAIVDAYAKLELVYAANDYAEEYLVKTYGVTNDTPNGTKDTSAIEYSHETDTDGKVVEADKDKNEKLGKFFTDFVLYYEVTVKETVDGKQVDKVYVYSTTDYAAEKPTYKNGDNTLMILEGTNGKPNGKYKVGDQDVTAKAFKFADVFNKEANVDAKYYVAVDVTKDLSANATYFARKARYEQLNAAKAEFATLFTKLTNLKALGGSLPVMSQVAKVDVDLDALSAWMAKYDLAIAELIDTEDLVGDALTEAQKANTETTALNAVKANVLTQILGLVDKKNTTTQKYGFGKTTITAEYAFVAATMNASKELKKIQEELVTPAVKGTTMSLSALFESWKSNTVETVKYADYETYQDIINRIDGYETKDKDNQVKQIPGIQTRLNAIYAGEYATQRTDAYDAMIGQSGGNKTAINNLIGQAKLLNKINGKVEALAEAFRDGGTVDMNGDTEIVEGVTYNGDDDITFNALTKVAKATDDLTGKETTTKKNDKDETITLYWVVSFANSDQMDKFVDAVNLCFSANGLSITEEDAVAKENYDLITKTAMEFLAQANTTFENTKKAFQEAYDQVKHVIYTIEKVEETEENTMNWTTGDKLYDLGNILWAQGIIKDLEKDYTEENFTGDDGKFVVESFKLNEDDTDDTVITYAFFRNKLDTIVSTAIRTASRANAAANTTIVAKLDAKDTTATGKKLSEYAGLNQNAAVGEVVNNFRTWCVTYLGAEQTYEKDEVDEDGNLTGGKETVPYTDAEFFANVEKYFVTATADGKATGILGIKNGQTPYAFIPANTFATIKAIDAAKDDKYEAARVDFLAILNNNTLLPAYATVEDIDSVCFSFVEYVKAYYMPDGESTEAVWEYYKDKKNDEGKSVIEGVTDANKSQTAAQTKIKNFAAAEKLVDKAARYATYIDTGIDFVINLKTQTKVGATEKELYTDLEAFIDVFNAVEDQSTANDFFTAYPQYTSMVASNGVEYSPAN